MRTLRNVALFLAPLVLLGGAACGSNDSKSAASAEVAIKDFTFSPARIEIAAGTEVTWTNNDKFLHTITSGATDGPENVPDGMFDDGLADEGSTASVTFEKAGTFTYYCKQHNAMDGTITVT